MPSLLESMKVRRFDRLSVRRRQTTPCDVCWRWVVNHLKVPRPEGLSNCVRILCMETLSIKILEPKARRLLEDMEQLKLIELERKNDGTKVKRRFGSMKGLVVEIADDFDAPLEDLEDYM